MKILKIKHNKNGSVDIVYTLNSKDTNILKGIAKKRNQKYSIKFVNSLIMEGINNLLKQGITLENKLA